MKLFSKLGSTFVLTSLFAVGALAHDAAISEFGGNSKTPHFAITDVIDDANADKLVKIPLSWSLSDEDALAKVSAAKDLAMKIYGTVIPAYDGKAAQLLTEVRGSLDQADVEFPPAGSDYYPCAQMPGVLAFVKRDYDGKIRICSNLAHNTRPVEYVAQTIVHEAVHTVGIGNECTTTEIEVAVMRKSDVGLVFKNGYWRGCDIQ